MKLLVITATDREFREFLRVTGTNPVAARRVREAGDMDEGGDVVFYGDWHKCPMAPIARRQVDLGCLQPVEVHALTRSRPQQRPTI